MLLTKLLNRTKMFFLKELLRYFLTVCVLCPQLPGNYSGNTAKGLVSKSARKTKVMCR